LTYVGVAILVGLFVAVATFNASRHEQQLPNFAMPHSMLLQIRDDDRQAQISVIVAGNGKNWFVIPKHTRLVIDDKNSTVAKTASALTVNGSLDAVANSLDAEIEHVWQLDRLGLAALVESINGVDVVPDEDLVIGTAANNQQMVLQKGKRIHLNGSFASQYALAPSSPSYEKFLEVWTQVMSKTDAATLSAVLNAVGSVSRASLGQTDLVSVFEKWQQIYAVDADVWKSVKTERLSDVDGAFSMISASGRAELIESGVRERIAP
jgi:hypothetical protein